MSTKSDTPRRREVDIARVAWIFAYVVPLILVALLCLAAKSVHADGPEGTSGAPGLEEELTEGHGEEECEIDEEGFVYCAGLEEDEEELEERYPPEECLLRTAQARAFTFSSGGKLRLVMRYTAVAPTNVSIEYRLKGGRGGLNLGRVKRHFGMRGLFQVTEELTDSRMDVAQAARNLFVKLRVPGAPGYCNRYYRRHLIAQKAAHKHVVWLQSGSAFGT